MRIRYDQKYPSDLAGGFIEVHNLTPLSELNVATITTLDDLICVCADCHRMIHRTRQADDNLRRLLAHFGSSLSL